MLTRAAVATLLLAAASAHADSTLVVVTPSAPVIVPSAPQAIPPGAEEAPPAAPARAGAPQNEAWSNVSHINGAPVPVGERNRYLYSFKNTNVAVDPFGAFLGYYEGGASFALSQHVALSVSGAYWSVDSGNTSGYQIVASAPIYFRRTFSGPYLEPGLMVRNTAQRVEYDCFDSCSNAGDMPSDQWGGMEMLFGYQWTFDSGLDVQLAMGVARHLASNHDESNVDVVDSNGYFRVGYAF